MWIVFKKKKIKKEEDYSYYELLHCHPPHNLNRFYDRYGKYSLDTDIERSDIILMDFSANNIDR